MLALTRHEELPIRGDHIAGNQAVDREPKAAHEMTDPAAQSQPANASVSNDAASHGQPEGLGLVINVPPHTAALCPDHAGDRINPHPGHRGEVDHHSVITQRVSCYGVPAASHSDRHLPLSSEPHCSQDIRRPFTAGDHGRPALDVAVPDLPGPLVAVVARFQHRSQESVDLHYILLSSKGLQTGRW